MSDMLTIHDAVTIADIIRACQTGARVKWAVHGDTDVIAEGVARAITTETGMLVHNDTDVRDAYVWISGMMEHFIPIREIMKLMDEFLFVVDGLSS